MKNSYGSDLEKPQIKVAVNEDTFLQTQCCSVMIVSNMLHKPGNICCRQKMFLKEIRNIFCVRIIVVRVGINKETFVFATFFSWLRFATNFGLKSAID